MKYHLITGATGSLGSEVLNKLIERNEPVKGLSSKPEMKSGQDSNILYGNLETGEGLHSAISNASTILHCASNPLNHEKVDIEGTKNLLLEARNFDIKHLIYISIVGADKSEFPYYKSKIEVEKMILNSGIPCSILRTTQFHNFILHFFILNFRQEQNSIQVPEGLKFQSIDVHEVANAMCELISSNPTGLLPDFGGPEILSLEEMTSQYLKASNSTQQISIETTDEGFYNVFKTGNNLCPDNKQGKVTWHQFLKNELNID